MLNELILPKYKMKLTEEKNQLNLTSLGLRIFIIDCFHSYQFVIKKVQKII